MLLQDLRYALRQLRKSPAFTLTVIVTLALGIGANTTIFSMVSRFVLRPAPVGDPATLLALHPSFRNVQCGLPFSWPLYEDVRDQSKSFAGVAAYDPMLSASIGGSGEAERVWGQAVTTNFFDVTELRMTSGRGFANSEESAPVVVLSARLWQRRFNGDAGIVGKAVTLSGHTFTVIGIAPDAFHGVDQLLDTQFWVPLGSADQLTPSLPGKTDRNSHWLSVVGRLQPGVTRKQAAAELDALARRLALMYPETDKDSVFVFEQAGSLPQPYRDKAQIFLAVFMVVVLLILAIASANVTNLLYAKAASREREMAVRLALGATRGRLRRPMLLESVLLGLGGGLLGAIFSLWATRSLSALHLPIPIPIEISIHLDWPVLLFTFGLSVLSGLLLGVAPAWSAARPRVASALKGEDALARPGRRWSLRNVLVVGQIAISTLLLVMTGLFLRNLESMTKIDIGFHPQGISMLSVDPREHGYSPERTIVFLNQLRARMAALPGVTSVACTDAAPLSMAGNDASFHIVGRDNSGKSEPIADLYSVTSGYFDTLKIPRLAGRDFGNESATGPKTAIINRAFAEQLFGSENPIGQMVAGSNASFEIVGVVGNTAGRTVGVAQRPVLYRSLEQTVVTTPSFTGYALVVRTSGDPAGLLGAMRREVHAVNSAMAVFNEETMEEHVRAAYFLPSLPATLFGIFSCIGLLLATVGLYGVMSYAVSRRTREIGIRLALGAEHGAVERLILRQGMVLAAIAVALGWPMAWMASKLAASLLNGVQPHDALTFVVVPLFMMAIATAASYIPARRAASIESMLALRSE
jgi:predicted permease